MHISEASPRLGGAAALYSAGGVRALTDGIVTPGLRYLALSSLRIASVTASERFQPRFSATASNRSMSVSGTLAVTVTVRPSG
jgi:hypothetical protein